MKCSKQMLENIVVENQPKKVSPHSAEADPVLWSTSDSHSILLHCLAISGISLGIPSCGVWLCRRTFGKVLGLC